jgi:hypothetical protein
LTFLIKKINTRSINNIKGGKMFEFILMLLGLILIYLIVKNFQRFSPKGSVILISLYTIFIFLTMVFQWEFSIFLRIIISVVMFVSSIVSIIIGISAFSLSETMEEKTPKVIKRQKLGQGFGITLLLTSIIVLLKVIINLFQIFIPCFF